MVSLLLVALPKVYFHHNVGLVLKQLQFLHDWLCLFLKMYINIKACSSGRVNMQIFL